MQNNRLHIVSFDVPYPPDYGGGIEAGADAIIKQMSLPPDQAQKNAAAAEQAQQQRQRSSGGALPGFFWFMIIAFVLLSMIRRRTAGRRYRSRRGGFVGRAPRTILFSAKGCSKSASGEC